MGPKVNELGINTLLEQARKISQKPRPQKIKPPSSGDVYVSIRNGRPYYYHRFYATDERGRRVRKKEYLGTTLPKGMRIKGKK